MGQNGSSPAQEASRSNEPRPTDDKLENYREMKHHEVPPDDATIVLVIGATGAGKSSLIRLATGVAIPVGNNTQAGTSNCQIYNATYQNIPFAFIDCPGYIGDDVDIISIGRIGRFLCDLIRHGRSLHGILYLHDINAVRETIAMQRCLKFIEVITNTAGYQNITFVTTKWDRLNPNGRIACNLSHNNLVNCRQWQTFSNHGARDCRHDGLDDLPNPAGVILQTAQTSLLNVLQFYLNNPGRMSLHLETQFRQRNQDLQSTIGWLLSCFEQQQTTGSTGSDAKDNESKWSFNPTAIAFAIGATCAGVYISSQGSYIRARPTWNSKDGTGFRVYCDDDKKSKYYKSWANDVYREQALNDRPPPEGWPSNLFQPKGHDSSVSFLGGPHPRFYLDKNEGPSFSVPGSSTRPPLFNTMGFMSSDSASLFKPGQRF